jgi:LCP family protein required for cell wall assembly
MTGQPEGTGVFGTHGGAVIAGKIGYAVSCVIAAAVLLVAGYAYHVESQLGGIESSNALSGGPQTGEMNILLMGLESRTDYNGNILSPGLLAAMHAGSVYGVRNLGVGGQATNTLILIHIFAGGKKAVGISIPRDDWITFPKAYDGQSAGKIDQAYGLAWAQSLGETASSSIGHDQRYQQANEAGQAAAIASVQEVTGQHVDHFAEVNLAGFYALAQAFKGVEVCVKPWNGGQNLHDANSGFNQKHAGYMYLSPPQALAFVRERDNLPNGDLDRTHRQQAVIDYVIWKLEHQGVLTDLGQLNSLLDVAKQYVITDADWDLPLFATEMHALTGKNFSFQTAKIAGYQTINGQAANAIDIPTVQRQVRQAFTGPAPSSGGTQGTAKNTAPVPPTSTVTVDVYNGSGASGLAGGVSQALVSKGYKGGAVNNAAEQPHQVQPATQVFYNAAAAANAAKIAGYFGATASISTSLPAGHVEVLLGTSVTAMPVGLGSPGAAGAGAPKATATSAGDNGAASGTVTVNSKTPYGTPCVY